MAQIMNLAGTCITKAGGMHLTRVYLKHSPYTVGLTYELLVLKVLGANSFHLVHTGGAGDKGQDFHGYWDLPNKRVSVVGQCKCFRQPVGPSGVREFEDVLFRKFATSHNTSQSIDAYIGVMASKSWFTPAALKALHSSTLAMALCQIIPTASTLEQGNGSLNAFVLNRAAQTMLADLQVVWRAGPYNQKQLSVHCQTALESINMD